MNNMEDKEADVAVVVVPASSGESRFHVYSRSCLLFQLITVHTVPGMDPDWLIGERGNQKGKVPVTYLELLS